MLTREMFADEATVWGRIHCGQYRTFSSIFHNAGWYNARGEKLGYGDLNADDLLAIAQEIDEMFVVLPERASYWDFVMNKVQGDEYDPGIAYVAENAVGVIVSKTVYLYSARGLIRTVGGHNFMCLDRKHLRELVLQHHMP